MPCCSNSRASHEPGRTFAPPATTIDCATSYGPLRPSRTPFNLTSTMSVLSATPSRDSASPRDCTSNTHSPLSASPSRGPHPRDWTFNGHPFIGWPAPLAFLSASPSRNLPASRVWAFTGSSSKSPTSRRQPAGGSVLQCPPRSSRPLLAAAAAPAAGPGVLPSTAVTMTVGALARSAKGLTKMPSHTNSSTALSPSREAPASPPPCSPC
mmetsp:Transcript_61501/g.165447  ORF Transcript_61501/g.165447 Transcript_61501/m.165447 type:complete len:210 (-) Transcript_61501:768-1397(-)